MDFETPLGQVHTHFINENRDAVDERRRGRPTHARWYASLDRLQLGVEWKVPSKTFNLGVQLEADCEDTVNVRACVPPIALYFGVDSAALSEIIVEWRKRAGDRHPRLWEREISLRVFEWAIWWNFWTPSNEWSSRTPKWRNGSWHPFGHPKVIEREDLETRDVDVPFPTKTYRARATRQRVVSRSRMPFSRRVFSVVQLDFEPFRATHGMPEGRKGCIFSTSGPARSIDEAVGKFVGDELPYNREREPLTPTRALANLVEHFTRWMGATAKPSDRETAFLHFGATHFDGTRLRVSVNWKPELERGGAEILKDTRERAAKQAESYVPPIDEGEPS